MLRFACPWDRSLKASTCVVLLLLLAAGSALALLPWLHAGDSRAVPFLHAFPALAVGLATATWLLSPRAVTVGPSAVRVERRALPVVIPMASIRSVQVLPPDALRGALRTFGCSGLFGHFGRFWSRQLGAFRMYCTSTRGLVLLETDRGRVVISPAPAEEFVDAVRALRERRA